MTDILRDVYDLCATRVSFGGRVYRYLASSEGWMMARAGVREPIVFPESDWREMRVANDIKEVDRG